MPERKNVVKTFDASTIDRSKTISQGAYVNGKPYQDHHIYEVPRITKVVQSVQSSTGGARYWYVPWDGHITHLGEKVIPSDGDEVRKWIDRRLMGDEYCKAMDAKEFLEF